MNPKNRNIIVALAVIIVVALVAFFSLNHQASKKSTAQKTVKVGIMSGDKQDQEVWKSVAKTAKEKYDLKLKFVYFLIIINLMKHFFREILMSMPFNLIIM